MLVQETNVFYPDRVQEVILLGVSVTIRAIWNIAKNLVHHRTQKKVQLIPYDQVNATMQQLIPAERLPRNYGGQAPALPEPGQATSLEAQAGMIAAASWRYLGVPEALEEPT